MTERLFMNYNRHTMNYYPKNMPRILLLLASFFYTIGVAAQTSDCDLKKDKDGVKVYTCKSDTSKFRSLKAEFVIENTSIEELKKFMFTVPGYLNWQYNVTEATMLKQINDNEMIYRAVIRAPWPLDDREIIAQFAIVIQDPDHANFYIKNVQSDFPLNEDLVRIPYSQSSWDIIRINNSLHVTYKMNVDPGGYVPAFFINMAMADGPYQSFRDLKKLIQHK